MAGLFCPGRYVIETEANGCAHLADITLLLLILTHHVLDGLNIG